MLGVEYLMRCVSTKDKSEKIAFYVILLLVCMGPLITVYH